MNQNQMILGGRGLRLFVVEDEAWISMLLEDMLSDLGCTVVGVAGTLAQALGRVDEIAETTDGAILDVNLGGQKSYPVADALSQRRVPFVFSTGYGRGSLDERYRQVLTLAKPFQTKDLAEALTDIRDQAAKSDHAI
ncbi:MAG: response regulator [Phenylobacterium sp.]|uniref:response regulator n=1 Tax=Phenylobacterium sp. TaxID=1871053 RepID=UPI0027337DBD|nr:response regulator [Phenylobacterium sp.]MDP3746111.1 response regulator [Phenylobacterium sp.]